MKMFNSYNFQQFKILFFEDFQKKYIGSRIGVFWSFINPILLMITYTFVFAFVFKSKLPGSESTFSYVLWIICGLGPWLSIVEGIINGSNSIIQNKHIVKSIKIRLEIIPLSCSLTSIVTLSMSLIFVITIKLISSNSISFHLIFLPLILALQYILIFSIVFIIVPFSVFIRDTTVILPTLLMIVLFVSPILYPIEILPEFLISISNYNPFYLLIKFYREIIINEQFFNAKEFFILIISSTLLLFFSMSFFNKFKNNFISYI